MPPTFFSAAADRNKHAIGEVLQQVLPARGHALEIASGTGQHVAWFASALPQWTWQPTDWQSDAFSSMASLVSQHGLANVAAARVLDVMSTQWLPVDDAPALPQAFDAIYCANMLHIAPWATCAALMRGGARHLAPGGRLVTYGPYLEDSVLTSAGNLDFDQALRAQNPAWGIRRRDDVEAEAAKAGLHLATRHTLPANNLLLVWQRVG